MNDIDDKVEQVNMCREGKAIIELPYYSYVHACRYLSQLEAIDYFFANEVIKAIYTHLSSLKNATNETISKEGGYSFSLLQENTKQLWHIFAMLSQSLRQGHTCLTISKLALLHIAQDELHIGYKFDDEMCLSQLLNNMYIGSESNQLVVYSQGRLYMRRYFQFEQELEQHIVDKLSIPGEHDAKDIKQTVMRLFPEDNSKDEIDWQKLAVANALNKKFSIIAGGPGTGKTYTVTKLLAAIYMLSNAGNETVKEKNKLLNNKAIYKKPLEIALTAPTGKAAQRLRESIEIALLGFKGTICDEILSLISTNTKTLHRLLGVIPNSPNFKHNEKNLLSCDVLLIDEVSMVDLPMMARIFRALKPEASVIFLGDADQLPSVAVGSVLADLAPSPHPGYSDKNLLQLSTHCQLSHELLKDAMPNPSRAVKNYDYLSFLLKSRRFDGDGYIGKVAKSVIKGDVSSSWALLHKNQLNKQLTENKQISHKELSLVEHDLSTWLKPLIDNYYKGLSHCDEPTEAFELLAKFRILCVMRVGEFGVESINTWVSTYLSGNEPSVKQYIKQVSFENDKRHYHGMPVMITQNNYRMNLFNGDIGLIWFNKKSKRLVAYFEHSDTSKEELDSSNQQYRQFLPSRLPTFEPVYAMTIHKTQGSEFEHVALILPKLNPTMPVKNDDNQLLSRELLYTGITRAKKRLTICTQKNAWEQGVKARVNRESGLF